MSEKSKPRKGEGIQARSREFPNSARRQNLKLKQIIWEFQSFRQPFGFPASIMSVTTRTVPTGVGKFAQITAVVSGAHTHLKSFRVSGESLSDLPFSVPYQENALPRGTKAFGGSADSLIDDALTQMTDKGWVLHSWNMFLDTHTASAIHKVYLFTRN